jgi:hypothetical protein
MMGMMGRCAQNRYDMAQGRVLGKETSIMYWRSGQKNQAAFQIIVYVLAEHPNKSGAFGIIFVRLAGRPKFRSTCQDLGLFYLCICGAGK